MKMTKISILNLLIFVGIQNGHNQVFVNLNFESARIPNTASPGSLVPISAGLPGWTGYFVSNSATNQTSQVVYDGFSLGGSAISINDSNTYPGFAALQRNYSAYLFGGIGGTAVISQTGLVPSGTKSLFVDIQQSFSVYNVPFTVSLNGQTINLVPVETFPAYTLYGGDISSFAGQVATLAFANPPPTSNLPA